MTPKVAADITCFDILLLSSSKGNRGIFIFINSRCPNTDLILESPAVTIIIWVVIVWIIIIWIVIAWVIAVWIIVIWITVIMVVVWIIVIVVIWISSIIWVSSIIVWISPIVWVSAIVVWVSSIVSAVTWVTATPSSDIIAITTISALLIYTVTLISCRCSASLVRIKFLLAVERIFSILRLLHVSASSCCVSWYIAEFSPCCISTN